MIQSSFAATKPLGFSTPMAKRPGSTIASTATKPAQKSKQTNEGYTCGVIIGIIYYYVFIVMNVRWKGKGMKGQNVGL